uniref:Uncharacterized protein n=1 Tax=Phaeocystis cordata TaxID=118079 RepID=A0A6T5UU76_9EUKA
MQSFAMSLPHGEGGSRASGGPGEAQSVRPTPATEALEAGLTSGLKGLAASSVSVFLANQYWPAFRHGLNVSAKTALVVTPFFFYFFLDAEHQLAERRLSEYSRKGPERG